MSEAESVETPIQEDRIKPDLTEVIEPETEVRPPKPSLSNWQRAELLQNFHKKHGNFEDVKEYVQNEEQNQNTLWQQVNKSKKRLTSEEEYHQRMEQRIEDLMTKVDAGELTLEDLTPEDRQVIIEIKKQNEG
jgi:superfamily I DNA and RNA helicase